MAMDDETWSALEAFAREELGKPLFGKPLVLTPVSRLEQDLGLTGVDAVEFIDKWAATFKIEARGFPYDRYFGGESLDVGRTLLGLLSKKQRAPKPQPLTLGMLADAMRRGRWNTVEIEAAAASR
jgi:hypothetical protein